MSNQPRFNHARIIDRNPAETMTPDTYKAFCHIAAGPISTPDLASAMGKTARQIGRRVAQLRALKLVETDCQIHVLTNYGRAKMEA
jgi:hypothetical protein